MNATFVGFVAEPSGRGTLSLLYSCLGVLLICVWGALHLNLPKPNEGNGKRTRRYLFWTMMALLCPELLLWISWRKLNSARELTRIISKSAASGSGQPRQHSWTILHSFYAGMGGFAIDLASHKLGILETGYLGDSSQLVLTPHGVELLAQSGHLPDMDKKEIEEKNRADILAKTICCLQVGWMVLQSVERYRLQLPLSLLEVYTLAHVLCALALYALWWHKPKMITEPTCIRCDGDLGRIVAFMFMASQLSAPDRPAATIMKKLAKPELAVIGLRSPTARDMEPGGHRDREARAQELRRKLASEAVSRFPFLAHYYAGGESDINTFTSNRWTAVQKDLVTDHASNWPDHGLLRAPGDGLISVFVWLASVMYGAVHLLAWLTRFAFPSDVERWAWGASAAYLIFSGVLWAVLVYLDRIFAGCLWSWDGLLHGTSGKTARYSLIPLMALGGTLSAAARLFLLGESLASLRATPPQVYACPQWAASIPHM
ncbi:hypothetical protein B0T25DRAFT_443028 [Lasiosphaeria hispida]|uniref:Uncharacterized protein n=1 Tax=Lasiosphaeria hispida TaxID=260671 RepID=A0AAJ0ML74_9PEZI|nr:hypothetical protein B0T25DRAFT_443028 [Lasiosphaeria hispida]